MNYFTREKSCGLGPRAMDCGRVTRSTVDQRWRGPKAQECGGALTGSWAAVDRRCKRGDEWRWLQLSARAKEGVRELRREGKNGGEGRGYPSPFIGAEGAPGMGVQGGNGWH
jgi:hypothetical protein